VNSSQGGGSKDTWVVDGEVRGPAGDDGPRERPAVTVRERTSVWPIETNWQDKQSEQQQQ
jgi:hypothetical protein